MDSSFYSYADDEDELPFNVEYHPDQYGESEELEGWDDDIFANAFDDTDHSFHGGFNVDGTAMIDDVFDYEGGVYGNPLDD